MRRLTLRPSLTQRLQYTRFRERFRQSQLRHLSFVTYTAKGKLRASRILPCQILMPFERRSIQVPFHFPPLSSFWIRQTSFDIGCINSPQTRIFLRAYYRETVKESWVEKLPAKTTRWTIFTGIGLGLDALGAGGLGTAAGVALS